MSYIVKNCPSFDEGDCASPTEHIPYATACEHIEDCKLKQIVENLKQVAYACHCDNCDGCGYYSGCGDTECGTYQALKSLELLDIQEVE